jgi:hypothetical protein
MEYNINFLFFAFGSHEKAADSLGYTARHYRKIRKKIEDGEEIPQRIEKLLQTKVRELQLGGVDHGR